MSLLKRLRAWIALPEPDPELGQVRSGLIARVANVEAQIRALNDTFDDHRSDVKAARGLANAVNRMQTDLDTHKRAMSDDVERLDASVVSVRGMITGGKRKSARQDPEDDAVRAAGANLVAAIAQSNKGDGTALAQIVSELSAILEGGSSEEEGQLIALTDEMRTGRGG